MTRLNGVPAQSESSAPPWSKASRHDAWAVRRSLQDRAGRVSSRCNFSRSSDATVQVRRFAVGHAINLLKGLGSRIEEVLFAVYSRPQNIITLVLYLYFLRTEIPGRLVPVGALKGLCGGAPPPPRARRARGLVRRQDPPHAPSSSLRGKPLVRLVWIIPAPTLVVCKEATGICMHDNEAFHARAPRTRGTGSLREMRNLPSAGLRGTRGTRLCAICMRS